MTYQSDCTLPVDFLKHSSWIYNGCVVRLQELLMRLWARPNLMPSDGMNYYLQSSVRFRNYIGMDRPRRRTRITFDRDLAESIIPEPIARFLHVSCSKTTNTFFTWRSTLRFIGKVWTKIMEEEYQIVHIDKPEESAWGIIGRGVGHYNKEQVGDNKFQRLCFVLQAPDQEIVGGVLCEVYWGWLYIDLLWIKEELRGRGHGHRLLMRVENEARQRGAKNVYLDTFSFQVPDFYKDHGYQVFGELQNFPSGHQRYFLTKQL